MPTRPSPPGFKKLTAFDKGNFFTATRQFDRAVAEYETALKNKKFAAAKPWAWELAAKRQLAITVRVKRDPRLTLEFLSVLREKASIPASIAQQCYQRLAASSSPANAGTLTKEDAALLAELRQLARKKT